MRLFYTIILCITLQTVYLNAQSIRVDKVAIRLLEKTEAEPDAFHSVNIVLADRVDLAMLDAQLSAQRATPAHRSETVISALKTKALETQDNLLFLLKNSPRVKAETVRSYWVTNVIFAEMQKEMIAELTQRHDVEWIGLNGKLEVEKVEKTPPPPSMPVPNGREPGLGVINAPALWAMGYTGYGQVAFTNDTGVDPTHPAIASRFRGLYTSPQQAWFDYNPSTGQQANTYTPFDCSDHGTHVTGTILGLDRLQNDTIGVAFNAQWVGAAILCGIGTEDNVAAFQWSLDPDGNPATTDDMPDIINNSWRDPSITGSDCFSVYVSIEEAMEAAGIAVVFSAGNSGPDSMTITPPHNININEVSSFTVGALNGNSASLPIANFSSRGPSICGGDSSLLIKPEVSAPGVSVRSCVPGNTYDFFSGTSMAAPHVSGAILLLKEAFPDLTGKELKLALYHTCIDLGDPGEDNTYGMGVIDVLAAFNYLVDLGHEPVSPYRANDVLLVSVEFPPFSCEEQISPEIIFENAGTDTLYSFDVSYEAGAFSNIWQWTGILAPGERSSSILPSLPTEAGTQLVKLSLTKPNGVDDERPLNNRLERSVFVTTRSRFQAKLESVSNTACENTTALLRGEFYEPGSVEVSWFSTSSGGTALGEGIVFETPTLTQSTTFFAEATYTLPLGLADKAAGEEVIEEETDRGMVFEVFAPIKLKSVKVFADATGSRIFLLKDPEGATVKQKIASINQTGEATVVLGWDLEPGIYTLEKSLGKPIYHNTTGAEYPYVLEGVVNINGTTDGTGNNGTWYYFYDWQVEFTEPCGRTAVPVDVLPGSGTTLAAFTVSTDSLDLVTNDVVQFTNTSTDGVTAWLWSFGDGLTSYEENPVHAFTEPGTYVVSLSVSGPEGCTSFALDTIHVIKSEISGTRTTPVSPDNIAVFPNPVQDVISVHLDLSSAKPVTLRLSDMTGRVLQSASYPAVQADVLQLDASGLADGVYFLLVEMEQTKSIWKVVKI